MTPPAAAPPKAPTLAERLLAALPQTQCTRCGYPDSRGYAQAMADGSADINRYPPGGAEGIHRLAALTGRALLPLDPTRGSEGPRALAVIDEAWCIGCTLCIKACPVDCIVGASKLMHTVIDPLCTGCELCVPVCPVDCIAMFPVRAAAPAGWPGARPRPTRRASAKGPVVFDFGDPFVETCRGNTRKVVVDNIPAPLLRYEDILSIAVDGANRKWFGTRNGIFVQSPDGVTQVDKFDVKNSPLLDNIIKEMAYNPVTGEMFIVSREGIQSYKTMTSGGGRTHSSNVYAYPNPVRPDYSGPISIKGLVRDANVKITDINGKLVYETKALGGQAIWDGKDYNGNDAATGVYLVFSANENTSLSPEALVTKILIVHSSDFFNDLMIIRFILW